MKTWNGWKVGRLIGKGAYGKVYEIEKAGGFKSALKVITIPYNQSELEELRILGMDERSIYDYYSTTVKSMMEEFKLMYKLRGQSNFVSYEDHEVRQSAEGIGWTIFIRMELLTSLSNVIRQTPLTEREVIKLGIDLSRALIACEELSILHRDIKPQNIFVNEYGDYKLGDFGIARIVERTEPNLSRKGTYSYMAPEVYKGEAYGYRADIYSLGIVLYQLLNFNRPPFFPMGPFMPSESEEVITRRMRGEQMPEPARGSRDLKAVVLKAVAYDPEDRYKSARELLVELEKCLDNSYEEAQGVAVDEEKKSDVDSFADYPTGSLPKPDYMETDDLIATDEMKRGMYSEDSMTINARPDTERTSESNKAQAKNSDSEDILSEENGSVRNKRFRLDHTLGILLLFIGIAASILFTVLYSHKNGDVEDVNINTVQTVESSSTVSTESDEDVTAVIEWHDAVLENVVREELGIKNGDITIADVKSITSISYYGDYGQKIKDITDIKYFTNITSLDLSSNSITDISALENLTNLTELDFGYNSISDINVLGNLSSLTYLDLCNNKIKDINVLSNLTNLTFLDLSQNSISDISVLENQRYLTSLNLRGNSFNDFSVVGSLTNLTFLDLSENSISDIKILGRLTNLTNLTLDDNIISDIGILGKLTGLRELRLNGNSIVHIDALGSLINLKFLGLCENFIIDISVLGRLTNLTELEIANNSISDISALGSLTNLTYLYIWENSISDVSVLSNLTNLETLYIKYGNNISDTSVLDQMTDVDIK